MISTALAKHLRDMRITCNRQFHDARLRFPHLDAAQFSYFLENCADDLVNHIEQVKPQAARQVAMAAYQHGLQLTGLNWLNGLSRSELSSATGSTSSNQTQVPPDASHLNAQTNSTVLGLPLLAIAWQRYLPDFIGTHTDYASDVMTMVAHALHQFSLHDGSQPLTWLHRMHDILPNCASFTVWKQAGMVLAWQAGLAHYRASALTVADGLPEALALRIAGTEPTQRWSSVAEQFKRNPWWTPAQNALKNTHQNSFEKKPSSIQERWRIGAFAEFGGAFSEPPQVVLYPHDTPDNSEQWYIKSGNDHWQLHADAYGATMHRLGAEESKGMEFKTTVSKTTNISGNQIIYDNVLHTLDDIQSISSWACNHHTLAVCSSDTFAVIVLSLGPPHGASR